MLTKFSIISLRLVYQLNPSPHTKSHSNAYKESSYQLKALWKNQYRKLQMKMKIEKMKDIYIYM